MSRRLSPASAILRQFSAAPGASVLLAIIVGIACFATAMTPRALDELFSAELRYSVASVAPTQRDLVATSVGALPDDLDGALESVRSDMGATLRSAAGAPRFVTTTPALAALAESPAPDAPITLLSLAIDANLEDEVRVVSGEPPAPTEVGESGVGPIEFAASPATAELLRWSVGETRVSRSSTGGAQSFRLVGIIEARDAASDYWMHVPSVLEPVVFDDGNSTPTVTGTGYVNAADSTAAGVVMGGLSTTAWFPVSADGIDFARSTELLADLREFTSSRQVVAPQAGAGELSAFVFRSGLVASLDAVEGRASATIAILSLAVAGPAGVLLAVVSLGARTVLERRRSGLVLASARGASPLQLRAAMGLEGLAIGLPAAAVAAIVAAVILPASGSSAAVIPPLALGLVPAVALAGAAGGDARARRSDLDGRAAGRLRLIAEITVVALAATSVVLLARRGLAGGGLALDPLLAASPLLLALAVTVLVVRAYPAPLAALARSLHSTRGLTGYLGAVRAVRDPAAGVAPILALVVGLAVAVFSGVVVTTVDRGVEAASRAAVGAELRLDGPVFDADSRQELSTVAGVAVVAGVDDAGPGILALGGERETVTILVVDLEGLREIRGSSSVPESATGAGGEVPVILSPDLATDAATGALQLEGAPVEVVAVGEPGDGVGVARSWVMVDQSHSADILGVDFLPRTLLFGLEEGADPLQVGDELLAIADDTATLSDPQTVAGALQASPAASGLLAVLVISLIASALLAAIAIVLASVVGARSRSRMVALLSTLGLRPAQSSALVAWELAPVSIMAIIAGTALGIAMPWVVLSSVDLTPFTGGSLQPSVVVDPLLVALLAAAMVAVVAVSIAVSVFTARRRNAASALRMGEE